ncbi:MAG: hypothetical protein CO093_01270 [Alphaproteobacteria bacterium CG_4_9_14_3_um_filter_47_13]|nr:MAG: hypothetical protein CO093_01270 [Alphaproteobacteria bacterium CG_4_9_14_3_um_filter_47_13]
MFNVFIIIFAMSAVFFAFYQGGKWRHRARIAEAQNEANRKALEIQNDVALDSSYRERVRRHFDQP